MNKRLLLSALFALAIVVQSFSCTNLIVGNNASTDGSTIVSYSSDSYVMLGEF